jgi:PPOX class probable FMN-dependent enzyme
MADVTVEPISEPADLRLVYGPPGQPALKKQLASLDPHCRSFIAHSPFVLVSTADADGRCDVSPKGGPPGFVAVLDDHHLALGDLSGNNRLDTLENLTRSDGVGLLFLVPGIGETLRVNGRAVVTTDPDALVACALDGRAPKVAIVIEVEEAYIHCAKALRRSRLWEPDAWPDTSDMARPAAMLRDHIGLTQMSVEQVEEVLEADYQPASLWRVGGND